MKKLLLVICISMAVVALVAPGYASELWDPHVRGLDQGLAAGALPPPGFYFIHDSYFMNYHAYGPIFGTGQKSGNSIEEIKLFAYLDVPTLLWVPGCKFLGADYGAGIAQPFDYTNLKIQTVKGNPATGTPSQSIGGTQWGTFNTILVPYILSWSVPHDFHIKTAFSVGFDDGGSSPQDRVASITKRNGSAGSAGNAFAGIGDRMNKTDGSVYAESANGTYMLTPSIGISWLHGGWNLSAEFFYSYQTKNTGTNYKSGDQFAADYTVAYNWRKWTFGLGAAQENQIQRDKFDAGDGRGYHSQPGTVAEAYTMGPIVGYNFGPCSLMFTYNWPIYTNNDVGGEWFNVRLVIPLGK